jgi:hypothetical protein
MTGFGSFIFWNTLIELSDQKDLPSSPNPFSQIWEKGSETFKVPLPYLGEGFRVRAKTRVR